MLVLSWILTTLAYAGGGTALAIGLINPGILGETITLLDCIIATIAIFIVLGWLGHFFATKAVEDNRSGASLAVWIISFIPYILPTLVILLLIQILRILDWILYTAFDTHAVAQFVNTVTDSLFGKQLAVFSGAGTLWGNSKNAVPEDYYVVYDSGFERKLFYFDQKSDSDPDSPHYMDIYTLYKDDTGNYWRSYDGGSTFVKETLGKI